MSFIEAMQQRYTTKKYDAAKKIDAQKKEELKSVLHLSPSSINSQPWKFTFVSDPATKENLSKASAFNATKILDCDTVVVFSRINNIPMFEQQIERELPQGAVDYYRNFIQPQGEEQIYDWFSRQVYLASGVLLSACAQMGIDATPMEGIDPKGYDKVLNQKDYSTLIAVAIGYRADDDANQPAITPKSRRDKEAVIESIA